MHCTLAGKPAWWRLYVLLAMVALANFFAPGRGWAQSLRVPLGRAAQFGLLSGGSLTTDSTAVGARGKVGAAGAAGPRVVASDSLLSGGASSVTRALSDVQAAIAYAQGLPAPAALPGQMSIGGLYEYVGNTVLDTLSTRLLTGDSTTRYVICVSGNLVVKSHSGVWLGGGVRPEHVTWVVGGTLTCEPYAALPGIVLVAGTATITGIQHGEQALLATGSINFSAQDAGIGRAAYASATALALPPQEAAAAAAGPCSARYGDSFLRNGNTETAVRIGRTISNMIAGRSDVAHWQAASGSPDYFQTASPPPTARNPLSVGIPLNHFGTQTTPRPATDRAYMGLYPYSRVVGGYGDYYDYIHQSFGDNRLEAGRWYYGEFYVSRGEVSTSTVTNLGMYVAEEDAPRRWFERRSTTTGALQNSIALLRRVPVGGTYATSPLAVPQIQHPELTPLSSTTGWVRVSGCFQATGNERCVIIGSFTSQSGSATAKAYYYVDDATLTPFPRAAAADTRTVCGTQVTLGTDDCPLPDGAKAIYWWTDDTGTLHSPAALSPVLTVSVTQTTTYTLHVRVDLPNTGGQVREATSTVTVRVEPSLCRIECVGPNLVYFTDSEIYGKFTFVAGQAYAIGGSFTIKTDAEVTVEPGAVLLLPAGARIDVEPDAVFSVAGGTLTNACNLLWDAVYVAPGASFFSTAGPTGRRAEVSFSEHGVVLSDDPTILQPPPLYVEHTDFRHNLRHLTWRMAPGIAPPYPNCYLRHCTFDSDPTLLQDALGARQPEYGLWGIRLGGDLRSVAITDNTFGRGWLGVFATESVRLGSARTHTFTRNTFRDNSLAGVFAGGNDNQLVVENCGFQFSEELYPTAARQFMRELHPLVQAHDSVILYHPVRDFTTFGVFSPHGPATLKNNRFEQPDLWHYANLGAPPFVLARNWQVGAYVNDAANSAIEGNRFQVLHTGLLGLNAPYSTIVNNVFLECEYGLWVTAPNGAAAANTICINCNSFIRNNQLIPPYTSGNADLPGLTWAGNQPHLGGQMYPIYVEHANALVINEFRIPYQQMTNGRLMGNLFYDGNTLGYVGAGLGTVGHERAIVQNEPTPLLAYHTYADDPTSLLLRPVTLLTTNQINPTLYNGARNLSVTYDANPVGPNYDCAHLGYQQGLQNALPRMGRVSGLLTSASLDRYALAPNAPNPFSETTSLSYLFDGHATTARLDVRDLTGRLIHSLPLPADATQGTVALSLQGRPAGVYVAQLVAGGVVRATRRLLLTQEAGR